MKIFQKKRKDSIIIVLFVGMLTHWGIPAYSAPNKWCSQFLSQQKNFQGSIGVYRGPKTQRDIYEIPLLLKPSEAPKTAEIESNTERLNEVLNASHRIRVAIWSVSLSKKNLESLGESVIHYDTRGIAGEVLRALNPNTDVLIATSLPVSENLQTYLLSFLPNERRSSVKFINALDLGETVGISRPLSQAILESPKLISAIKNEIRETPSYLSFFLTSSLEEQVSQALGIPFLMIHPQLNHIATKTNNRRYFQAIQQQIYDTRHNLQEVTQIIPGFGGIESIEHLLFYADVLWLSFPQEGKFVIKHDNGVSGQGNGIYSLPQMTEVLRSDPSKRLKVIQEALNNLVVVDQTSSPHIFLKDFTYRQGIVEKFIDGTLKTSPSGQGFIHPDGRIEVLSTHEQILNGYSFEGAIFPANKNYRLSIQEHVKKVGQELSKDGVVGPFSVDYLVVSHSGNFNLDFTIYPVEINIRQGGTHPHIIAQSVTNSIYDPSQGILKNSKGESVYYISTEYFKSEVFKGWSEKRILETLDNIGVLFQPGQNEGILPYLLSAAYKHGKFGFVAIAASPEKAKKIYDGLYIWIKSIEGGLSETEAKAVLHMFLENDITDHQVMTRPFDAL